MARILILGGGFAAIAAAERLVRSISEADELVVVSSGREFVFSPALVPMVFGDIKPEEIHFDVQELFARHGIRFVLGEATSIDTAGRSVEVDSGGVKQIIRFDKLLIALGRTMDLDAIPGFLENAHHMLGIAAALKFKEAVHNFDSGKIVVALGPGSFLPVPVCETALALAKRFSHRIAAGEVSVKIVFPSTLDNAFTGSTLFRDLETEFERKGIELVEDFPVTSINTNELVSSFGSSLEFDLLMMLPPFSGRKPVRSLASLVDEDGFLQVNGQMQVRGFDDIYAAGDIVSVPGPRFGYLAIRQARVAADNIAAQLKGRLPDKAYDHRLEWVLGEKYTDPVFFHYGFWDDTLEDFDDNAFFGMARSLRRHYGLIKKEEQKRSLNAVQR